MAEINLLSWRAQKYLYERKRLKLFFSAGMIAALMMILIVHVILNRQVRRDEQRLQKLSTMLSAAAKSGETLSLNEMTDGFITAKTAAILLDVIARSTVSGACYQQLSRDESGWRLAGQALSVTAFTSAWHALAAASYFKNSVVNELKKDAEHDYFQFVVHAPE